MCSVQIDYPQCSISLHCVGTKAPPGYPDINLAGAELKTIIGHDKDQNKSLIKRKFHCLKK